MTYDILIPILAFLSVVCFGAAVLIARSARRKVLQRRLVDLGGSEAEHPGTESPSGFLRFLGRLGLAVAPGGPSQKLREHLARAGYFGRSAAAIYLGLKMLLLLVTAAALAMVVAPFEATIAMKILLIVTVAALVSFAPNILVSVRRSKRSTEIEQHLPDAIDLLEICVTSGMGLDMAWNSVADHVRGVSPIMADEMSLANLEMQLGSARIDALRHMADRTGVDELSSLVGLLVQSERFGTSVSDALRTYAESMRQNRSQRAEENAEKVAVKLLFPMVLFIFPAFLIVTAGPAGISIATMMSAT